MNTFYIVRHGETENNRAKRLSGWIDTPLTDTGLEPTKTVIEKLQGVHIDEMYASDLGRAFTTAYVLARGLGFNKENPAAVDGYNVGDTYKTKDIKVNGATAIDLTDVDEDCTMPRWLIAAKDSYAVLSLPELCPVMAGSKLELSDSNQTAYQKLVNDFVKTITVY